MRRSAYALATILVLLGVSLFAVGAVVTITGLEAKIARSQTEGATAYYVAEAGMADALWQLNNTTTYRNALAAGTLNASYTVSDAPQTGQSYTVTLATNARGAGYATVTVEASHNNGTFVARRRVSADVFAGAPSGGGGNPLGTNGLVAGGNISISNGSGGFNFTNGDFYSRGNISLSRTTVNGSGRAIKAEGNYTVSQSNVMNISSIQAANHPPAPPEDTQVPGINYSSLAASANVTYSGNQFTNLIHNASGSITFPGPVTYVNGNVSLTNSARNTNVTITGLLIINGNFSLSSGVSNFNFTLNNPGTNRSGIIVNGNISLNSGNLNLNGLLYSSGNMSLSSIQNFNLSGIMVTGGNISITPGGGTNFHFQPMYAEAIFGGGGSGSGEPEAVEVQHWEEEY